jgi:MFS family permease
MFTARTANARSLRFLALSQASLFASNGLTIPLMANHFGALGSAPAAVGLLFAAQQAGSLVAPYIWGAGSDKIGRRRPIIVIALALSALSLCTVAFLQQYAVLLIAQCCIGIASAGFSAGNLALAGDLIEDDVSRGRMLGMFRMTGSLAFALTAVTGGFIADGYGLWVPIAIAALLQGLGCFATIGIREASTPSLDVSAPSTAPVDTQTDRRHAMMFFGVVFIWFYGMGAVAWQWPGMMHSLGYPQSSISALWALAALGEVPGLALAGILADRWGRRPLLMSGLIGQGLVYALYRLVAPTWGIVPLQMFRSLSFSSYETPALLVATELGLRQRRGRYAGLYHTVAALGGVVGASVGGFIVGAWDYATSFTIAGGLMIVVSLTVARKLPVKASSVPVSSVLDSEDKSRRLK